MKVIASILEEIKFRFPHTDLHALKIVCDSLFEDDDLGSRIARQDSAKAWGCSVSEVAILDQWLLHTPVEEFDNLWAEVGH